MSPFYRCLLVLGLAGLPLVASQNANTTNATTSPFPNATTSPVQDLVELLVALVKQSGSLTTSQKSIVSRLNAKLNSVSLPAVMAAQQKDQALVNYHASVVAGCDTSMSQHVLALGTMATSIAKLKAEHEQCETDKAGFLAERHTASSEFIAWLDAEAGMTPSNAVPQDESEVEAWVERALFWWKSFNATYTEFKVNESNAVVEAKIEVTNCAGELTGYTESYCSWAQAISVVTSTYTTCRSGAMSLYDATLASVKASAAARRTEFAGLSKAQCLLNALVLDDSGVSGELDACENAPPSTSDMIITEPELAGYSQTLVDEMGTPSDSSIPAVGVAKFSPTLRAAIWLWPQAVKLLNLRTLSLHSRDLPWFRTRSDVSSPARQNIGASQGLITTLSGVFQSKRTHSLVFPRSPFYRCLLVLGLAGLPLVASQNANTTNATTSSPVQDLVELLVALVKQSGSLTTSQKSIVSRLNAKLNSVSLPAVMAARQKDQALVNYHASVVAGCDTSMSQHVLALGTMATSIAKLKAEHEQCETDRAGFLAERHTASSEFIAWLDAEAGMTPSNAVPQDESEVEAWVERALFWWKSFNATYTEFKVNESNAVVEAKIEVTNCAGELTGYTESYCSWAEAISVVTSTYTTCRSGAMSLYDATLASVKASAAARRTEFAGLSKAQCLLNALVLDDSGVSGELDACENAPPSTSDMIITEPELAGYSQTLVDEMGTPSDSSIPLSVESRLCTAA
ncbi:unnamed protein product [Polarella glacialis]|uniref:Uncharacterized protein n=1 Tax=Polarella glacialis TaxID=89957 RepID=A0A813K9N5_POLGL|nr:unnamed protein product [Polarella glacialis]